MQFKVEHRFSNTTLADFEKTYLDEACNIALCNTVKLLRTLVKMEDNGGKLHRVVKVCPDRELPGPVAKVLGTAKLEYTEYLDYTWGTNRGTWKTISAVMTDKVASSGTFSFRQEGSQVVRTVEGDVKVSIFGLGGLVERGIIADVEKSYVQAAEFMQRWINNGDKV